MADSTQQETASAEMPRNMARALQWTAQWTAGQLAGFVLASVFAGTGGLYVMAKAGFISAGVQLTEIGGDLKQVSDDLKQASDDLKQVKERVVELKDGQSDLEKAVDGMFSKSNDEHAQTEESMKGLFGRQRDSLAAFEENLNSRMEEHRTHVSRTGSSIREGQRQAEASLSEQINGLSNRIVSIQSAFVERLEELVEEGKDLIGEGDFAEIERWITKANYVVRSLEIPAEDGLLRDTSVVKEDLRDAMSQFDKAQGDNAKLAQAQRVLVIVEAVYELAVGDVSRED